MISIILPTYNCAPWLRDSIQSVLDQSYSDWELIVIDDGSEDNSVAIASEYCENDSRIKIYKRLHGGIAAVRNFGLEKAQGEYVAFIDSDDIWPDYYLSYLYNLIENEDAGIVSGKILKFIDGREDELRNKISSQKDKEERILKKSKIRILTADEAVEESLYQQGVVAAMWGKLFRRDIFDGIRFHEGELYEDLDVFYRVAMRCRKFVESDVIVYFYRQRTGSILHTFGKKRLTVLDVTRRICEYMDKNNPYLMDAAIDRRFSANFNMLVLMHKHRHDIEDEIETEEDRQWFEDKANQCKEYISRYALKELKNKRVRLKNKLGALSFLLLPRSAFRLFLNFIP